MCIRDRLWIFDTSFVKQGFVIIQNIVVISEWKTVQLISDSDSFIPQLIVAAVECSHSPDNGRLSEYSPYEDVYKRQLIPW